jgi:2-polyprenyl-3-methyl-5-hydroxy-6-metoxy-1,4-benzoquinol methylase
VGGAPGGSEPSWRAEERPCPVCGASEGAVLGRRGGSAHRTGAGVETSVVRCRGCHAVYPRPVLIPSHSPYDRETASSYFHAHSEADKRATGAAVARTAERLLGRRGTLLEVGCGTGGVLRGAAAAGWSVQGVEMTAGFVAPGGEVPIEIAPAESAASLRRRYDAVVLAGVLEHVYDPRALLARCVDALVPGGVLYVDVPNECGPWTRAGNAYMRLRGRDWAVNLSPTFAPFHVVGFCPRSLKAAIAAAGLEVVELAAYPLVNTLPRRPGAIGAVEHALAGAVLRMAGALGFGDGLICWARRRA